MSRVFIIGGHGKVARLLTPLLVAGGHRVTAAIRNPAHADEVAGDGATPLLFDIEQAGTEAIAARLADHDAVVWAAGAGGGDAARTHAVDRDAAIRSIDAARRTGVRRYVMLSYITSGRDQGLAPDDPFHPYATAKAAADTHLRGSGLDWTIIGPGRLTMDAPSGRIALDPGAAHGATARGNVAMVIATALATPATVGRTLDFVDGDTPIAQALDGR
ncbi:SDR family oxidoreductase [Coralloluteibacterium stylophorae]|uniref:SDR family oxidoreductase n=1 Tax=Coralloluteibacterium stylophorae TaxID=1776034 RepID=A0A8J7VS75_9GAMM|nr:SDR family oxidoreductase [Coralloluteibacterium stylophorae]MBS7456860.1 SDR family oxidoreductase [Coralloluteibacterium stylophorae]